MAVIKNVTPILRVEDLETSRCYYIQTLGFTLDWPWRGWSPSRATAAAGQLLHSNSASTEGHRDFELTYARANL